MRDLQLLCKLFMVICNDTLAFYISLGRTFTINLQFLLRIGASLSYYDEKGLKVIIHYFFIVTLFLK